MSASVVLLDGLRPLDPAEPVLRADDLAVLRGEAVFETTRVVDGRPVHLERHLERLARSAARLDIALPTGWRELALAAAEGRADAVLRLVCAKGPAGGSPTGFALVTDVPEETVRGREQGVRAITLTLGVAAGTREQAPWLLGGVKSTSYAVNMASLRHAHDEGADDAVWLSSDGEVLEAPTATVGIVVGGTLVTPPTSVGILPGVTVAAVLELGPSVVRRITAAELATADEVLLMSSVRGVAPVIALDGRELGTGPVTAGLRDAYEASLR